MSSKKTSFMAASLNSGSTRCASSSSSSSSSKSAVRRRRPNPSPQELPTSLLHYLPKTLSIIAGILLAAVLIQWAFPPSRQQIIESTSPGLASQLQSNTSLAETLTPSKRPRYQTNNGMTLDRDGIWRDIREIRIDDDGDVIWVAGGLRKNVVESEE